MTALHQSLHHLVIYRGKHGKMDESSASNGHLYSRTGTNRWEFCINESSLTKTNSEGISFQSKQRSWYNNYNNGGYLYTAYPALALSGLQSIITLVLHVCVHFFYRAGNLLYNWRSQSLSCDIHIKLPSARLYVYTPGWKEAGDIACSDHLHTMMTELDRESNPWPLAWSRTPLPLGHHVSWYLAYSKFIIFPTIVIILKAIY